MVPEPDLADHQVKAVARMHNGSILTGGVGTGKTRTAMRYYIEKEAPKDVIVITTAKKRDSLDWEGEAILHGVGTRAEESLFGKLTVDSWNNLWKYIDVTDAFFIFDEQRLVGSGKWVRSFYKIAKNNRWILLSATPGDTWLDYIPVFVANGFYKNQTEFQREHVVYSRFSKFPKVEKYIGVSRLVKHRNSLLVDMPYQRHTKRIMKTVEVAHDESIFKKVVKDRWHVFEERPLKDVAELYSVMRKVVNSDRSRVLAVRKLMTVHPRLIVFYNFDYELEILRGLATPDSSGPPSSSAGNDSPASTTSSSSSDSTTSPTPDKSSSGLTTQQQQSCPLGQGCSCQRLDSTSKERDDSSGVNLSSIPSPGTGTSPSDSRTLARERLKRKAAGWPNNFGVQDGKSPQSKSSTSTKQQGSSSLCSPTMSSTPSATGSETKTSSQVTPTCSWNPQMACTCLTDRAEMCLGSIESTTGVTPTRSAHYQAQLDRIGGKAQTSMETTSETSRFGVTTASVSVESLPLSQEPVHIAEWNGHKHQEIPNTERWVYLVQYTAGAEGWNCTSTDTVVFYSLNYSYRIFEQCQGRIDRLNTPFTDLTYYILMSTSWIDKVIWKAVQLKKTFNEKAASRDLGEAA